jgi:3-oxoacyl-[acyl-carrier protein] reductase
MNGVTGKPQKSAIVTGASRGIGRAVALELAASGCRVIVNYLRQKERAEAVVAEIRAAGREALAVRGNVQEPEELDHLFAVAKERFGHLDILVNNAGVGATLPLELLNKQTIDDATAINVRSVLLATQRAATSFGPKGGVVINVSSAIVMQPIPAQALYAATKAAVEALTRVLAQELGPRKIRVNAVAPGPTETDLLQINSDIRGFLISRTVLGRLGVPQDIAKVVAFLASDASGWITGQTLSVDGGLRL